MDKRREIIDNIVLLLKETNENPNKFFEDLDVTALSDRQLQVCFDFLVRIITPKITGAIGLDKVSYAIRNQHGLWYSAPGHNTSASAWEPFLNKARLYKSIGTARNAIKTFNIQADRNKALRDPRISSRCHHLCGTEIVTISHTIGDVVPNSEDYDRKKALRDFIKSANLIKSESNIYWRPITKEQEMRIISIHGTGVIKK